jgi:hypothetical protein
MINFRPLARQSQRQLRPSHPLFSSPRTFTSSTPGRAQQTSPHSSAEPERPANFYTTYGRAFAKVITLAFLTYQITYWTWLTLETEAIKDEKNREIRSLEHEIRLLDEGRKSHRP